MNLDFSPEELLFREEARTWLEEHVPRERRPEDGPEARAFDLAWQQTIYAGGWAGISWPKEYGGRDLSMTEQLIWFEEYARAEAPWLGTNFVGQSHAGPTIIARGTPEQQALYLPPILKGEVVWCQGFSEPGSGSDLASLRTRAVIDGDELVVNGQKIWTSFANIADIQELLVRTDPDAPKHKGITWVVCDMASPGITIRPIRNIAGRVEFCEVFYDDVRIPLKNVVGEINDGWSVAMSTLSFERGTAFMAEIIDLSNVIERLIERAKEVPGPLGARTAWDDDRVRADLAQVRAELAALRALNYATVSRISRTGKPGPEGSIVRFFFSQILQRTYQIAADVVAPFDLGGEDAFSRWTVGYSASFRATIAAGTKDIQRNTIAERLLGLPKDR